MNFLNFFKGVNYLIFFLLNRKKLLKYSSLEAKMYYL